MSNDCTWIAKQFYNNCQKLYNNCTTIENNYTSIAEYLFNNLNNKEFLLYTFPIVEFFLK